MTTQKLFGISCLIWLVIVIVSAVLGYIGFAMGFAIAGLLGVCIVVEIISYLLTGHYKVVAKNRYGHMTVFATQSPGVLPLVVLCFRAIAYYRWINLQITRI
jgi:hypothetical protein